MLFRDGRLDRVGRGLYTHPDAPVSENHPFALVAKRVPESVICLLSALRFHELTTQLPNATWIAVPSKARLPVVSETPLQILRFDKDAFTEGVNFHRLDGVNVRITNPARTVVDCFKYRKRVGRDVAVEALRDAMNQRKATLRDLIRYAKLRKVSKVMQPYLEFYQ